MHPSPSVLVVDRSEETREVLQTALSRRGIQTFCSSRARDGAAMARTRNPDLIVLDLEVDGSEPDVLCSRFGGNEAEAEPPMVLLGTVRPSAPNPRGEIISKPYHYAPLIRRIEEILETVKEDGRKAA